MRDDEDDDVRDTQRTRSHAEAWESFRAEIAYVRDASQEANAALQTADIPGVVFAIEGLDHAWRALESQLEIIAATTSEIVRRELWLHPALWSLRDELSRLLGSAFAFHARLPIHLPDLQALLESLLMRIAKEVGDPQLVGFPDRLVASMDDIESASIDTNAANAFTTPELRGPPARAPRRARCLRLHRARLDRRNRH